jgi:beta-lactam-binding protein with PASTA domain
MSAAKEKAKKAVKDNQWIWRNLLMAFAFIMLLVVGASISLRIITRHGKTVIAPDFTNLTVAQAEVLAKENKVAVKVVDSVFVRRLNGGVVYRQQPKAGSTVKQGRSIFLTINSVVPRKVVMPNLFGYSVTEARSELQNRGLNMGYLSYVKDIATNTVLGQSVDGVEVKAGDLVVSGSTVDLTVAVADENNQTQVPRLIGMKYVSAIDAIHDKYLNVGTVRFDSDIRTYADSVNAVVYKQDTPGNTKTLGAKVNFSLTLDSAKLPAE